MEIKCKSCIVVSISIATQTLRRETSAYGSLFSFYKKNHCSLIPGSLLEWGTAPPVSGSFVYIRNHKIALVWREMTYDLLVLIAWWYNWWLRVNTLTVKCLEKFNIWVDLCNNWVIFISDSLERSFLIYFLIQPLFDCSSLGGDIIVSFNGDFIFDCSPCVCVQLIQLPHLLL